MPAGSIVIPIRSHKVMLKKIQLLLAICTLFIFSPLACSQACPGGNCQTATEQVTQAYPGPANVTPANFVYPAPDAVQSPVAISAPPEAPSEAPKPQPGTASISGLLYSYTTRIVIPETMFYLTSALGDKKSISPVLIGPDPDHGDIMAMSDKKGQFSLDNVPAGDYYLVVWAPYNWSVGETLENNIPKARLLELKSDQSYPLGVLYLSWP